MGICHHTMIFNDMGLDELPRKGMVEGLGPVVSQSLTSEIEQRIGMRL